ncbi:MAG: tRNA-binding protein [archaeon]
MWDTSEDYRFLVAQKSIDYFLNSVRGSKFRGKWNKNEARKIAKRMRSDLKSMQYSYMSPNDLADSEHLSSLIEKYEEIVEILGGEDWYRKFLERSTREERDKVEESIAEIRFFLNTISGLEERLKRGKVEDPVVGVDIKVGRVMSVRDHPNADNLELCNVNISDRSLSVITNDLRVSEDDKVAVSILPPNKLRGIVSEGMFLGADDGVLRDVKGSLGSLPQNIPLDSLNETRSSVESFLE